MILTVPFEVDVSASYKTALPGLEQLSVEIYEWQRTKLPGGAQVLDVQIDTVNFSHGFVTGVVKYQIIDDLAKSPIDPR